MVSSKNQNGDREEKADTKKKQFVWRQSNNGSTLGFKMFHAPQFYLLLGPGQYGKINGYTENETAPGHINSVF